MIIWKCSDCGKKGTDEEFFDEERGMPQCPCCQDGKNPECSHIGHCDKCGNETRGDPLTCAECG